MGKVLFGEDQLISASEAAKHFADLKKRAAIKPQFILSGGKVEAVMISFDQYQTQMTRLHELEETALLLQRIDRLEKDHSCAIPWEQIRRSPE